MNIIIDDLLDARIELFLNEHLEDMKATSPPESKHALDIDGLRKPDVTFWSVWIDDVLVGCGAIKRISKTEAELKSMRVAQNCRGTGIASCLLTHIIQHARHNGIKSLKLETGSMDFFAPARRLYEKYGFNYCDPFAEYKEDPNSVFMELPLG